MVLVLVVISSHLSKFAYVGEYLTMLMVGVIVVLVVLVLVLVSSQLSKCVYNGGGYLTKLMVGVMVGQMVLVLVVVSSQLSKCACRGGDGAIWDAWGGHSMGRLGAHLEPLLEILGTLAGALLWTLLGRYLANGW